MGKNAVRNRPKDAQGEAFGMALVSLYVQLLGRVLGGHRVWNVYRARAIRMIRMASITQTTSLELES